MQYCSITPVQYITKQWSTVVLHQCSTLQSSEIQWCYTSAVQYKAVWYSDVTTVQSTTKQCGTVMLHQCSPLQSSEVQSITPVQSATKQCGTVMLQQLKTLESSAEPGTWAQGKCKFQPRSRKGKCSHNLQGKDGFLLNSFLYCG